MSYEAKTMAKKVCKRLEPLIAHAIRARPMEGGAYTLLQGYRTAFTLLVGGCLELGMPEGEMLAAAKAAAEGWKQAKDEQGEEPTQEQIEELRKAIKPIEMKCPKGWKKGDGPGVFNKKRLRIVMTGTDEVTLSISSIRHGIRRHPTDDQCQQTLQAFGFEDVQEVERTSTARYFKCQRKGLG